MRLRHLQVVRRNTEQVVDGLRSAESEALLRDDQRVLVEALKQLPARQREALVLRPELLSFQRRLWSYVP